jgi:hypothetical protein
MKQNTGARCAIDGVAGSYRDDKRIAIESP